MLKSYLSNFCLKTRALSSFRSLKALGSLLLLLFVGTEAQGILLVSNFSQPTKTDNNGNAEYHSYTESHLLVLGFWTPNTLLHTLTAIKVIIAADGKAPRTIELREANRNNPAITTFSLQGTYTGSGTNTYIPDKETVLKKDTLYLFALGHSKGGWGHVVQTSSNNEDAASQVDWRIADDLYSERLSKYTTPAVKMEVHGNYFAPVPTLAAGGVLLSNINESQTGSFSGGNQEFTTGPWSNGYKIRSIEVSKQNVGALTSQGLYQGNTKVADFNRVNAAQNSPTTAFTPTQSLTLAPNTTYSFRIGGFYKITSGSVDAYAGWSLGTHSRSHKMMIRIRADEAIAPAVIATPKTLVSNIKQSPRSFLHRPDTTTSFAQAFRTGINPYGYALRGMGVYFGGGTAPPTATVHENSPTGKKVTTFSPPHGGSPLYGLPDYVVLKKTTTYYVVFSGGNTQLRTTASDHEDSDSLAAYKGWNIANVLKWSQNGGAWQAAANGEAIRLRIAGEPLPSPPSQPTNVRRAIANGQVTLIWEPPLVNNYAPLLNYRINYKKTKDPNYSDWKDYPATARRAVIASLTNGEQYDFQIRARSSEGLGPIFKTIATPNIRLSAPRSFNARADISNNEVHISWDAPTTGTADYYQYRYYKPNENGTWTRVLGGASARSVIIGGLQRNVSYVLQLQAVNSAGAGPPVIASRTVALTINPPTNLRIKSASPTEATFTWDNANVANSIYQYRYKRGTDDYPLVWTDIASGLEQTITGLTIGSTYTFQVRTADRLNISRTITLTFVPFPPPQNFEVLTGPSKVYFSWDAPATGTVNYYQYRYGNTTDTASIGWTRVPGGSSARNLAVEISDTGVLQTGLQRIFYLRVISNISVGLSADSGAVSITSVASPTNFRVKSSTPTQATLVWDSAVDTSQIRYKTGTNDYPFAWTDITSGREQTITGLTPGTAYTFQLRSKVGTAVSAPLTAIPVPGPPRNPSATAGLAQVTLKWDAPNTGPTPTGYQYNYLNTSDNALNPWTDITSGREQTITGLTPGTLYIFSLRAKVANGNGSATTITATPLAAPPAIENLLALPNDRAITLTWDSFHSSFEYRYKIGSNAYNVWADTRNSSFHVISGLTNNAVYTIELRGKPSGPTTTATATPATVDFTAAPSSFVATSSGDGAVTLTWAAPLGGFPDGYLIRYKSTGGYSAWMTGFGDWNGTSFSRTISGLSNGTAYTFEIQGVTSNPDASIDRTPNATAMATLVPSPPQNPSTTAGYAQVALAWDAPARSASTGYQYRLKVATDSSYGLWKDVASGREQTITDLTVGTAYLFQVRSKNTAGSSSPLTFASTTPLTPPSAPSNLIAFPASQYIDLYWSRAHTSYESRYKTGSNAYSVWADTYLSNRDFIQNATNNVVYTIELRAKYPLGPSATATVTATPNPVDLTATPSNFVATPSSDGAVTLTWDAYPGGFPDRYRIRYKASGGSYSLWVFRNANRIWNGTNFSRTISGLTNGTAYTFELQGSKLNSFTPTASVTATPAPAPNSPRNPVATAGYAQVVLAWDAPATGPTPTSYQYRYKVTSASTYGLWKDVTSGLERTITGLTVGTTYLFQVRSKNTIDTSSPLTFAAATPLTPPPAPTDFYAFSRNQSISFYWNSTHTSFEYRYQAGRNAYSVWADTLGSISHSISSATNNVAYTIELRGKYPLGPSATATVMATPNPFSLTATPPNFAATSSGDGAVTLTWDAPLGGFPNSYQVRYKSTGAYNSWLGRGTNLDWNGTNFSRTISGLTNGTAYTFELRGGVHNAGTSSVDYGTTATAMATPSTTVTVPNPPQNPFTTAGYAQVALVWNAPATGFPPTGYQYRSKVATASSYGLWTDVASGREQTITALAVGTAYLFQVRSKNTAGTSSPLTFAATTPLTPPPAPQDLRALPKDQLIDFYWNSPHTSFEYRYHASDSIGKDSHGVWADTSRSSSHTISDLTNNTVAYTIEVRGKYPLGPGAIARVTATAKPVDYTAAPSNFVANPSGDGAVTLTWDAPLGGFPDRYRIRYKASGDSYNSWSGRFSSLDWNGTNFSRTVSGLTNGTAYTFKLGGTKLNSFNFTPPAAATATPSASAMVAAPHPPRNLLATAGYAQATLDWDAPTTGFTPTGYQYRYKVNTDSSYGLWTDVASGREQTIIAGLTLGTAYAFEVRAKNTVGNSSPTLTTATPLTPPPAPSNFLAIPLANAITFYWTSTHTSFEYRYRAGNSDYNAWATIPGVGSHGTSDRDLIINTPHTIEVRGKYPLGPGATATAMATPNPADYTAIPSNFVANPSGDGAVTLTWDAPLGGFPNSYQVRYKSTGAYNSWARQNSIRDWNGTNSSRTINGLINGTAYTFELRGIATLIAEGSTPTATATATPSATATLAAPPSAPQSLTAAPASTQVTLAWTAPASGTPTGYEYRYKSSGDYNSWTDTTSPKIIASLTNNTPYTFEVRAKSNSGPGAKATVSATPTAPNDPPTFTSLTTASVNEGTTAVTTLIATDPDDTTFTYSIFGGADSAKFSINSSSGALTFKTAPDFENPTDTTTNNEYIITLRVTSGSNPREMTTEQTLTVTVADTDEAPAAPAAPTLASRTPTTLTLNWTAPTNAGPPITDYDYRYSTDGNSWTTIDDAIELSRTFTLIGLSANTPYYVAVRAKNDEGTGSWSTSTTSTTLAAPPSAPQSLTAAPASTQVTLAWTAPASGTPTGYEYRYKSSGAYGNWTPATSPKIIASLTNDTAYTFEVRAKSDSGPGTEATVSATPLAPPSAPQSLMAQVGNTQITLAWTAPATGATPTGYQYRHKSSGGYNSWTDTTSLSQIIASLTNDTAYTFGVRAKSNSGPGTEATVSATPIASAAANAAPTFTSLATASVNEGTTAVTTLIATDTDVADNTFTYSIIAGADSAKFSINSSSGALTFKTAPDFETPTDATNNTPPNSANNNEYIVIVRVTSGSNARAMTTEQTLTVTVADTDEAPAAPDAPTFTSLTSATLTLNWTAPTNTGPPITDYDYRYSTDGNSWTTIANTPIDAISTPIVGLSASTLYYVAVRATNAEGTGSWSTSTSFTTPAAPPSAPQSLMATPANNQVTLAWEAPATGTPTGYEYRYKSSGDYNSWTDTTTLSQTIASLTNDTAYTFGVRAKSNSGPGTETMVSATPAAPPSAPQSLMAQVGNQQITLAWEAPASGTPTGYEYRYKSSGAYGNWTTATSPKIIASLTNDTPHTFEVRAKSDSGPGETLTISATPILPNSPPTFTSLTTATVNEGTTAVTTLTANDTDSEDTTFTYSIVVGADSAQFSINSSSGALTFNTAPDHETPTDLDSNNEYIVTLSVTSGSNPREITTEQTLTITVTDTNEVPTFTSPNTFDIVENQNTITTLIATDPDSDDNTFTYSIIGGADNAKFSINSSSGALSFKTAPDYENPTDVSILQLSYDAIEDNTYTYDVIKDNTYIVIVRATSGSGNRKMTTEQTLTITITDTNEVPSTPNAPTITSLTSTSLILNWKKPTNTGPPITDYDYRYSTDGNSWTTVANRIDNAMSNPITSTSGDIFYNAIANPITGLNPNTSYYVAVRATNAEGTSSWSTSTTFTTLTTASSTVPSAPQNSVTRISDQNTIYISWTAPATGAAPTGYEYRYKKATDASFTPWVVATEVLRQAQVLKVEDLINDTAYTFEVRAESDSGPGETLIISATPTLSNSPPTFTSLTTATVNEGTTAVTTLIATDPDDTTFTYSIVAGADSAKFSINSSSGALSFKTAPNFENPTDTTSNNEYIVTLSVTSGSNPREITTEQTLTITVTDTNEVPTFTSPNTFDIVENQNTITTLIATDPDSDDNTFTYSILGGADNAKFSLSGATLSFKTAPNFEATQSSANTNTYTLIVTATSGSGNRAITTEQTLTINVTDDTTSNDPIDQKAIGQPIITGSPQIGQRLTTSTTTIDDPIDGLTQPQYTYQWIRIEENGNEVVIQSANSYAYTPTQGDLGRTLKVRVEFIDDSGHSEILTSNATAAVTETTSTKELSAWLTRFGRATADQILNTVEERLRAYRSTGITLHFAGQHLPTHLTEDPQHPTENGVYSDSLLSWLTYGTKDQIQSQNMTEQELLMNSSFDLSAGNQENGFASLWGRMSQSTFQGYQNSLQLDGDITTGLLGADYTRGPWTAGLILSRSKGKGNYQGDTTGKAKASLNSLTPWAAYTGADQLSIWAATGYGKGDISLIPQEGSPQKTDIKLLLAALGTRGTLLDPSTGPRIELFSDARWVQTTSKSTTELKATQTHTARLRLGLEGSWYTTLSTGSVLIPRLTLGLRKDSGDAETGFGTDIGTHITLAMPQGLTLSLEARGLLSHQAKGFQDQGWSGTLQWDSKPDSEQGFTLSLSQSKGAASSGGTHALFAHETLEQLTLTNTDTKLIQANIAYGLPPFGNQLTARSELTLGLSDTTRQYSLAWHVSSSYLSAQSFDLSLQGTRHESIDGALAPRHSLGIQLGRQW